MPFVDESTANSGDTYSWLLECKDRLKWGLSAHAFTASEARGMQARYAERERRKLDS